MNFVTTYALPIAAALSLVACDSTPGVRAPLRPAKILLVSIDTTRADHVSAYGYSRPTTPRLAELARAGVRFASCYSAMPTTDPSHATMLTGQHPRTHGILRNADRRSDPDAATLASWLAARGYTTAAITARLGLHPQRRGLAGFDHADAPTLPVQSRDSAEIVARVQTWLAARTDDEPWFLWVHLWEPHKPYAPDRASLRMVAGDSASDGHRSAVGAADPPRFLRAGQHVDDDQLQAAVARYDAEIRMADAAVARVLDLATRAAPVRVSPLAVIVSDHGESLGERRASRRVAFGHGALLYDEVVRVPWLVWWPGVVAPRVVAAPVSLVDLAPTVMDLVEPGAGFATEGRSLARLVLDGSEPDPDPVPIYVERRPFSTHPLDYLADAEAALLEHPWKLIVNDGRPAAELYRLDTDPAELRDRAADEPERVGRMRARLEAWKRARPIDAPNRGPGHRRRAELDALRSLGYID